MGRIPSDWLPPEELRPSRIHLLEEFRGYPDRLNPAQELLDRNVEAGRGSRPAIFFQDKVITYSALQEQVNRLGNVLRSRGVEEEDRVVILSPNQPLSVVANFAIMKIGAIPIPASPLLSPPEIAWVVNNGAARVLLVHPAMLPLVGKARGEFDHEVEVLALAPPSPDLAEQGVESVVPLMERADSRLDPVLREKGSVGVLLYTSGTTGKPKGVVHLVEETLAIADTFGKHGWKLTERDVVFSPAPLAFAAGYGAMAIIPFRFGAAVSIMPRFEPEAAFETIQNHKATVLTILPTSYRKMLQVPEAERKYDLSSVRMCTGGGEALTAETFHQWHERFGLPIYEGLGTTEMFYVFVSNAVTEKPKAGSIGTPVPGYEVKVVDEEGNEVGPGQIGRMLARGPTGVLYWRPKEEQGRLLASQRQMVVDGWNAAGDYIYADDDGYLWFVAREDDLIKSSGYRIGPDEIEMVVSKHPAVADVGVIGVPDPVRGQNTKAFVVLKEGFTASAALKQEIIAFCRDKIAVYKLPREVEFVDELPRTVTGKLLRRVLRAREQERYVVFARFPKEVTLRDGSRVTLRPLVKEDAESLVRLFSRAQPSDLRFLRDNVLDPRVPRRWCEEIDYSRVLPIVAETPQGEIVADASIHRRGIEGLREVAKYRVFVDPSWRGKGLSTALLSEAEEVARALGVRKLVMEIFADEGWLIRKVQERGFRQEAVSPVFQTVTMVKEL